MLEYDRIDFLERMSETNCFWKNREVILNRAKEYCEYDKEQLRE